MTHPVIQAAKGKELEHIVELSTGIRAIVKPVSASLMQDVMSRIVDPQEPWKFNEEKGREEPDPWDKEYLAEIEANKLRRGKASIDAMAMFGIELVDGLPEDDTWLRKLKQLERFGYIDLSEFILEDPLDLEFLYKRYVALGNKDLILIGRMSGIRQEDIAEAEASFRGNAGGDSDTAVSAT